MNSFHASQQLKKGKGAALLSKWGYHGENNDLVQDTGKTSDCDRQEECDEGVADAENRMSAATKVLDTITMQQQQGNKGIGCDAKVMKRVDR